MKTDISILGSGIVSQVLALLLARARIRVSLSAPEVQRGQDIRSFALNAASRQVLIDLRAWPERACPVQHMQVMGEAASQVRFDAAQSPLAWIVDACDLQERLTTAIQFCPEISLAQTNQALFSAELTVICEGRMSQTRQAVGAAFEQFAYEQTAIAALIDCDLHHENTAWQWMRSSQVCALLPREVGLPGNSVALVWSVPKLHGELLMAKSPQDFCSELQKVCNARLGSMRLVGERASWPLLLAQAQQWSGNTAQGADLPQASQSKGGAWVLAGDAAHAVHPLAGQGLNLGLGDAVQLAHILANKPYFRAFGDVRLLRTYERARKAEAARLRLATDGLQQLFGSGDARLKSLRQWGMQSFEAATPLKAWLMRQASGVAR